MENRPQSNVRFVHCRNLQEDGTISPKGGMTIAYNINKELNSVTHPKIFAPLREILVPPNHHQDKMFRLETRARIVN